MDLEDFEIGRVVKHRSITRPKPKNPKHLQPTNWYLHELKERLKDNREISDEWIYQQLLSSLRKEGF